MSSPPEPPDRDQPDPSAADHVFPAARAALVLVLFVIVAVYLLGVVHPSTVHVSSASSATPTTTPRTTPTPTTHPVHSGHPATTTTTTPPGQVHVLVANASNVSGAAAAVTNELRPGGWNLLPPANATSTLSASQVYFVAGFQPSAAAVAVALQLPSGSVVPYTTAAPIGAMGSAQILVAVASDLANRATSPSTTTTNPATTTTHPAATTTTHPR